MVAAMSPVCSTWQSSIGGAKICGQGRRGLGPGAPAAAAAERMQLKIAASLWPASPETSDMKPSNRLILEVT
jgi:hypothetical protein